MLTKEETEARVGFEIPEEYWHFIPWGNRILVKRTPREEVTKGGLIIPNSSQRQQSSGTIVKLGHTVGLIYEDFQLPGQASVPEVLGNGEGGFTPEDLVGVVVTFNEFVGQNLTEGYEGDWVLLMAMDILGHNE